MAETATKDPKKQTAGRAGANARWAGHVAKGGTRGNIVALGSVAWAGLSLPVGLVSPAASQVMKMTTTPAGRDIDTLLKGTPLYAALTSGAKADKAMAAYRLAVPPLLAMAGDMIYRRRTLDPENARLAQMETWLYSMLRQVLAQMGVDIPEAEGPSPIPEPAAAPQATPEPEPEVVDDWAPLDADPAQEMAARAAAASRLEAL